MIYLLLAAPVARTESWTGFGPKNGTRVWTMCRDDAHTTAVS